MLQCVASHDVHCEQGYNFGAVAPAQSLAHAKLLLLHYRRVEIARVMRHAEMELIPPTNRLSRCRGRMAGSATHMGGPDAGRG
jgi:hypothetical protein